MYTIIDICFMCLKIVIIIVIQFFFSFLYIINIITLQLFVHNQDVVTFQMLKYNM